MMWIYTSKCTQLSRIRGIITLSLCLICFVSNAQNIYSVIDRYLKQGNFDDSYNRLIWNSTKLIVKGDSNENKITINQKPIPDFINIYVLGKDPEDRFKRCNCSFLGKGNVIICDKAIFDSFVGLIKTEGASPIERQFNANLQTFLFQWILGHEIGHLVNKHEVGGLYFSYANDAVPNVQKYTYDKENEADRYFVQAINKNSNSQQAFYVWMGLSNLISQMYPTETLNAWNKNDRSQIFLDNNPLFHPPWLYRFIHMVNLLLDNKIIVDQSGYFPFLEKKLVLKEVPEIKPVELCSNKYFLTEKVDEARKADPLTKEDLPFAFQRAYDFFNAAMYNEAIWELDRAISFANNKINDAEISKILYLRGFCHYMQGNFLLAASDIERIESVDKSNGSVYTLLGHIYFSLDKKSTRAEAAWHEAIAIDPNDTDAKAGLSVVELARGREDLYLEKREKIEKRDPTYFLYNNLKYEQNWSNKLLMLVYQSK